MSSRTERRRHRRRSSNEVTTAAGWRGVVERAGERTVFYILCLLLVLSALALGSREPWACDVLEVLALVAMLGWAARVAVAGKLAWIRTPLDVPLAVGAAYVVGRYACSPVEWISRQEMLQVLMYVSVYFLATQHLFRRPRQNALLWVLVATAIGITAYGFINWLRGVQVIWCVPFEDNLHRLHGTFQNPNHFVGYLDLVLAVTMAHLLWSGHGAAARIVLAYGACVMIGGIVLAGSRGGYVATAALLVFVVAAVVRGVTRRWWPVLAIVCAGLLGCAWVAYSFDALRERFLDLARTVGGWEASRFWMWQAAWQMFLDHPWLGAGPAIFNALYGRYRDPVDQAIPEYVHNDYLEALCDYGVAGFALMALLTGVFLVSAWRIHRRWLQRGIAEHSGWHWPDWLETDRAGRPAWLLGSVAAVIACMLHSVVDFNLHFSAYTLTLTVILAMGMLSGHARRLAETLPDGTQPLPPLIQAVDLHMVARRALATLLVLFLAANAMTAVPNGVAYFCQQAADMRHDRTGPAAARALAELAWQWDSRNHHTALLLGDIVLNQARLSSRDSDVLAERALQWYQCGGRLDPLEAGPVSRQARALEYLKRWKEAEAAHLQAHSMSPSYFLYYQHLGMFYARHGDKAKAIAELQTMNRLKWNPHSRVLFYQKIIKSLAAPPAAQR